jgi:putative addiction module CopG family antidote
MKMVRIRISLPEDLKKVVNERVASGLYVSASEYIRDLIRADLLRQHRVDDLRGICGQRNNPLSGPIIKG